MTPPNPSLDAINAATKTLNIRMFLFTDPTLLNTVIAAKTPRRPRPRHAQSGPPQRKSENEESRKTLVGAGIEVRDSSPEFALTHQKSMVIDEATGFVESLNWETRDLTETRDYAVVTTHKIEVDEMVKCFEADWHRRNSSPTRSRA